MLLYMVRGIKVAGETEIAISVDLKINILVYAGAANIILRVLKMREGSWCVFVTVPQCEEDSTGHCREAKRAVRL